MINPFNRLESFMNDNPWTDEMDAILTKDWKAGTPTAAIAERPEIRKTKSAIIGRAHRLGLNRHPYPASVAWSEEDDQVLADLKEEGRPIGEIVKAFPGRTKRAVKERIIILRDRGDLNRPGKKLAKLHPSECRFSISGNTARTYRFCGEPVAKGRPFCAEHCRKSYIRVNKNGDHVPATYEDAA